MFRGIQTGYQLTLTPVSLLGCPLAWSISGRVVTNFINFDQPSHPPGGESTVAPTELALPELLWLPLLFGCLHKGAMWPILSQLRYCLSLK